MAKDRSSAHIVKLTAGQLDNVLRHIDKLGPANVSPPSANPTPDAQTTPRPPSEGPMKIPTEARIDAGKDRQLARKVFRLAGVGTAVPGALNRVVIVSSTWKTLSDFCERNVDSVIYRAPIPLDQDSNSRDGNDAESGKGTLMVTVEDLELEDGTMQVSASMHVGDWGSSSAPRRDLPSLNEPMKRVAARFSLPLPASFAEIGRSCSSITVGEGTADTNRQKRHRKARLVGYAYGGGYAVN